MSHKLDENPNAESFLPFSGNVTHSDISMLNGVRGVLVCSFSTVIAASNPEIDSTGCKKSARALKELSVSRSIAYRDTSPLDFYTDMADTGRYAAPSEPSYRLSTSR